MLSRCAKDKPSVNYARIVLLFCEGMIVWCNTKTYNDYFDAAFTLEPTAGKIGRKPHHFISFRPKSYTQNYLVTISYGDL